MKKKHTAQYARSITRVLDHIEKHLDEELSVDTLSKVAHFSPFHFHRQFSAYTGVSVGALRGGLASVC